MTIISAINQEPSRGIKHNSGLVFAICFCPFIEVDQPLECVRIVLIAITAQERYDHRFNLIDWDYTMRVQPEASILHFLHYSHFRDKGLAYELRECEYSEVWTSLLTRAHSTADHIDQYASYQSFPTSQMASYVCDIFTISSRDTCGLHLFIIRIALTIMPLPLPRQPNYTLASRVEGKSKSKGQPVSVRGFWSDIVCGPFAAFALEADEPRLFEARPFSGGRMTQQ